MEAATAALAFGVLQSVVVVFLTADRWIHKVTGKASIETRVTSIEDTLLEVKKTSSATERNVTDLQLIQARQDEHFKSTDRRVEDVLRRIEMFKGMS